MADTVSLPSLFSKKCSNQQNRLIRALSKLLYWQITQFHRHLFKTKASATHLSACILQAKMCKPARVRCKR